MFYPLFTCLVLAGPGPAQLSFPVDLSSGSNEHQAVTRRADEHGNQAQGIVDFPDRPQATLVGAQQSFGVADWMALGPFGGDVADVTVSSANSQIVLAGLAPTSGGGALFRSADGGGSWTEINAFSGLDVYDIENVGGTTFYAGTMDGVWRSTDSGVTWINLPLGIGVNDQTFEVTIDPNNSATIWVGVANALGGQASTLLKSTNAGATWTVNVPLGGPYSFTGIAVDPGNSNKVVATWSGGFGGGGVFVSANGGATWVNRSAGLPGNPMNDVEHDGTRILIAGGQLFGGQVVGVYSSSNDGVTWTQLSNGAWPNRAITDLELDPSDPARILCSSQGSGIFESTDNGVTWNFGIGGTGGLSSNSVSFAPGDLSQIYVGSASNAIWKSANGGTTFAPSSAGIGQLDVYSVASNPTNPSELAIAYQGLNNGGVQTSTDGGITWSNAVLPATRFNTVGFDDNGTLYAISDGPTTIGAEGLYRRVGGLWTSIGPDQGTLFESELFALSFDPSDPTGNTIFSGGSDFGVAGAEPTIWRTADGGSNWVKVYEGAVPNENVSEIAFPLTGSGVVVASYTDFSATQSGGALRATDGGLTWTDSSTGLAPGCQGSDLSLHPNGTTLLLADNDFGVGNGGFFRSTDMGQSWSAVGAALPTTRVVHDPNSGAEILSTHSSAPRVRYSDDGGATQGAYDTGIPGTAFMRDLFVSASGGASFVATNQGVFMNSNGLGTAYCGTSPNSVGAGAQISASGSVSVAANDLLLQATGLPANKPGLFFYGGGQTSVPLGNGVRCVAPGGVGIFRYPVVITTAGGSVEFAVDYNAQLAPAGVITAGSTWNFQFWYRDPVDPPSGFNLSDALQLLFGV